MTSLEGLLRTDVDYPGIEIKVELIVLREYLAHMESGIISVCENYIEKEMANYDGSEYAEYQHAYAIAEDEIPRMIRMPLVVTIYAALENSVTQLLAYAKRKENKSLSLKDINGRSPISTFNKYLKHILEFDFQFSSHTMKNINAINKVRNCIAHSNGNLGAVSDNKLTDLRKISESVAGLSVERKILTVSCEFLQFSMDCVERALRELMTYLESRYAFN